MNTTPSAQDLWEGIAGHFDSITQVICEFIDNSVSNFEGNKVPTKTIHLHFEQQKDGDVTIQIEDTGTGIEDLEPVMRLGDRSVRETPLNEHGFGLKHALASANPNNDKWRILTRTEAEFKKGKFRVVLAQYKYDLEEKELASGKWPGCLNGSGTVVQFNCSEMMFNTLQKGVKGKAGFERCLDYLHEELGYIYAGVIEKGKVTITVASKGLNFNKTVQAVKPNWVGYYDPKPGTVGLDLGGGKLNVEYVFGEMTEGNHVKHYKRNMATSGVEIRINGRILTSRLFQEIWGIEPHPSYNHFLATINLVSDKRDCLPRTRTSKNGIRSGDEKLETLFDWIRKTHPAPEKRLSGAVSEGELVKELALLKEKQIRSKQKKIITEFSVFTKVGAAVDVDLYVYDGNDLVLYEAKKDCADVQNLYQLLMYWDGAVSDGMKPDEGILIASEFSDAVKPVLAALNSRKDENGKKYNFSCKTWNDEGIQYP
jgi:Histidine kinase-, DNA gyrase B-, and HSP90-like ATPase